jgi:tetratricopeptide (TPR) repeat protein
MTWKSFGFFSALTILAACSGRRGVHDGQETPIVLFDNLGNHHHAITTRSAEAQRFFDQGLRLIYGFNHDEAIRSFSEATRLDPHCAMAYWGIGFAYGPNYNLLLDDQHNRAAYAAVEKAVELKPHASEPERAYIDALALRYSLDPQADRKGLDRAFADAMRQLSRRYPDDLDAATLFAESMMDVRPWDLWMPDGKPQPGTEEIVVTLESVLARAPEHPGANHYYIHAIEASPHPERGLPSAQRLRTLVPGAGHLVHMPSHIYIRTGQYAEATETNRRAIEVDRRYLEQAKPSGPYPMMYVPHNIHFLWAAASMEGRSGDALQAADDLIAQLSPAMVHAMPMLEMFTPTRLLAQVRFGRWEDVLNQPAPPAEQQFTTGMWHYARGIAFAATARLGAAERAQTTLASIMDVMPPEHIVGDNAPAKMLLQIANETLAGEIAARRRYTDVAVRHLEAAVQVQDKLPYMEPPSWYYPVRQSLGAVLLAAGRAKQAEAVYRDDLRRNPNNGWSLYGLSASLRRQKKVREAERAQAQFLKAWERADVKLEASRF